MSFCEPGDQIICKVKNGIITAADLEKFDYLEKCEVGAHYNSGYLVYPHSEVRKEFQYLISKRNFEKYNLHKRFIDCSLIFVTDFNIVSISHRSDGMECCKCGVFYPMAGPNIDDKCFKCFICRNYPYG